MRGWRACLLNLGSTTSEACRERRRCNSCDSTGAIRARVRARALRPSLRRRFFRALVRLLCEPRSRWRLCCFLCSARSFRLAASESAATEAAAAASAAAIAPLTNSCTTTASVSSEAATAWERSGGKGWLRACEAGFPRFHLHSRHSSRVRVRNRTRVRGSE